jgi:hypothetical protein
VVETGQSDVLEASRRLVAEGERRIANARQARDAAATQEARESIDATIECIEALIRPRRRHIEEAKR